MVFFALLVCLSFVSGQYFEFTGNSYDDNGFQQWCPETYDVYFNTESVTGITAWVIEVTLDPNRIYYADSNANQQNLFLLNIGSSPLFDHWTDASFPHWESEYTEVKISASNQEGVGWYNKYWTFLFTWKYNQTDYYVNFLFNYDETTYHTAFAKAGNNVINPLHQNSRLTWTIHMEQKPCVEDTQKPMITITDYAKTFDWKYLWEIIILYEMFLMSLTQMVYGHEIQDELIINME